MRKSSASAGWQDESAYNELCNQIGRLEDELEDYPRKVERLQKQHDDLKNKKRTQQDEHDLYWVRRDLKEMRDEKISNIAELQRHLSTCKKTADKLYRNIRIKRGRED